MRFGDLHTPGGFRNDEVTSALQKAIRRGQEADALFWATELELAGCAEYTWNRLKIISVEDVGMGEPEVVVQVAALYGFWSGRVKKEKAAKKNEGRELPPESRLYLILAVQVLSRAKKSRMVDHIYMQFYEGDRAAIAREIPDYALDGHTARGRKLGRGARFFLEVSSQLENEAPIDDPYKEAGHRAHLAAHGQR